MYQSECARDQRRVTARFTEPRVAHRNPDPTRLLQRQREDLDLFRFSVFQDSTEAGIEHGVKISETLYISRIALRSYDLI